MKRDDLVRLTAVPIELKNIFVVGLRKIKAV